MSTDDGRWGYWLRQLLQIRDEPDYERQRALIEALACHIADLEDEAAGEGVAGDWEEPERIEKTPDR